MQDQVSTPAGRPAGDPAPVAPVAPGSAAVVAARLELLRAELAARGLAGFVVPLADEHQGEYLPPRAQRLTWLTGFTGSAGMAVVLRSAAAIFVDGRYTLQVRDEVPADLLAPRHVADEPVGDWLAQLLQPGERVGYDAWLHTPAQVARLKTAVEAAGGTLVAVDGNPLDAVWVDQPGPPAALAHPHPLVHAGETAAAKRLRIADLLAGTRADAVVLSAPDSIAWLLNVRGGDVPCTPFVLSFAVLHRDGQVDWFVDERKLGPEMAAHLGNGVRVAPPAGFGPALDALVRGGGRVLADPASAPSWVFDRIAAAGGTAISGDDPCMLPKACKNPVEIAGFRAAHRRDAIALVRFLAWLATNAGHGIDELDAVERLRALRAESALYRDASFPTISGSGPNGAIVHYRASPRSNRKLGRGELYLVDSGGQYPDATTDVTRTIAVGQPTAEMRDRFTRVLKGHIAIATAVFPRGTTGAQIDVLARQALWQVGVDFDHGTGHGVGSYLSVHEGPHRISKAGSTVALRPGMVVSNEPGYYKTGAFGIRIENLVTVVPVVLPGAERPMLGFETLTLAPIDRDLVDLDLLTPAERGWLDAYHARVRAEIGPLVDGETGRWLDAVTRPLAGSA
ncbi:Xaa-Pro aminopeptidase [Stella humosa]|uniref:Xaa-Pro aminopeptidase n=1 Tax=Stella humosa TaxID=94 RepID=A0A3N1KY97_9PROT|nr:aminopeptidase P family protein [Stella humosa]ROP84127.1 Xaa-Pro aminopeptidase [Stella humosa]BBK33637.1 Xaa-Pro aminopeptidase [Stella humosa]